MKKLIIINFTFISLIHFNEILAKDFTTGVGGANYYSGLGINSGIVKNNNFFYLSAGCPTFAGSGDTGLAAVCGVGGGWISSNLIPQENNKHAVGLYVGIISGKVKFVNSNSTTNSHYGAGINYIYYFNSLNANGWNLGLFLGTVKREGNWDLAGGPTLGYQFHY